MLKINSRIAFFAICFFAALPAVFHAKGVLDDSFGVGGKASLQFPITYYGRKILIQPDHKIIVAGGCSDAACIGRYNENGSFDASFNGGSAKSLWAGFSWNAKLQPDGKILIAGTYRPTPTPNADYGSILCRLNTNGDLDAGFGDGGCFRVNRIVSGSETFADLILSGDGKILALIGASTNALLRLNADGTSDTTFGTNGYLNLNIAGQGISLTPVARDKVLLASASGITRIDLAGTIDAGFGSNGTAAVANLNQIALQSDGKIIAAATQTRRLTSEGQPDTSFPVGGESFTVTVFPDDRIITVGRDRVVQNVRTVYLFNRRGGLIGREKAEYYDFQSVGNGKFLAVGPNTTLDRYNAITSIANGIGDLDNDDKSDISVFRPTNNTFYFLKSAVGFQSYTSPTAVGEIFAEDYTGDLRTDIVWWTPVAPQACYYGFHGITAAETCFSWGLAADRPLKGDYDGDSKTDIVVYRDGVWHTRLSSTGAFQADYWGIGTDKPVPADYDADGVTDLAVFRPSDGMWSVKRSSDGGVQVIRWGVTEDKPVPADYDGDGRADLAIFRPSSGVWSILKSSGGFSEVKFGIASDKPVPADYDGDGLTDIAVWRPADGNWYLLQSKSGFAAVHWGQSGDVPLTTAYAAN